MRTLSRKSFAIGLLVALLVTYTGRAVPVYALAVGPLADPVYETEIYAFKEYVEQNLDAPQLDIMFFLIGGLAVAQMGAQDAMLISPYPNEENVKEWIINCGIQLYNAVIALVPSGDYYMGIPSIGSAGTKGVPRQVIKALVAQMMGDAVVAINYPDLDTFLEENPNELYINVNKDLQLGVNAIFGLNGGIDDWQTVRDAWLEFTWNTHSMNSSTQSSYNNYFSMGVQIGQPTRFNFQSTSSFNGQIFTDALYTYHNLFFNDTTQQAYLVDDYGNVNNSEIFYRVLYSYWYDYAEGASSTEYVSNPFISYNFSSFNTYNDAITYILNNVSDTIFQSANRNIRVLDIHDFHVYHGTSWGDKVELFNNSTLNIGQYNQDYYNQLQSDYLLDIRGLIGDLVNYVYVRKPVFDNIYDFEGNNLLPVLIKISTAIENITELIAPPVPVNLNDIAELTENTYLERVKEHARNAGDIFANYVAFWHNCDSDLVYTMFGAAILVLVGAFVGKWGHS